jgi:sulfofructose kinase
MSENKLDAIGIGACNLDTVAFVPKFTEKEEKINASKYVPPKAAGVSLDALTMINNLGLKCGFIGKRGDDLLGDNFAAEVEADDIDISQCMVIPGEYTSLAWIQVLPNGERCHVIIPMSQSALLQVCDIEDRKDYIANARICHMELLQNPVPPLLRASEICKAADTLVSVDLDIAPRYLYDYKYTTPEELKLLIANTDVLKACKNAVEDISDSDDMHRAARDIMDLVPQMVVITIGEDGCVIAHRDSDEIKTFGSPAFPESGIVDTTGAGDAFQGGFIYGLLKGWPLKKAAIIANACGCLKSCNIGARNMPSYEVVAEFLRGKGWSSID